MDDDKCKWFGTLSRFLFYLFMPRCSLFINNPPPQDYSGLLLSFPFEGAYQTIISRKSFQISLVIALLEAQLKADVVKLSEF